MTKEELRGIYFGFYDQLIEPEQSRAKKNWDYEWAKIRKTPSKVRDAVNTGFEWEKTFPLQGQDYWWRISQFIEDYLVKEETMSNNSFFKDITEGICELLEEKDKRYGSALDNPLEIFAGKSKYGVRIDEKLSRIKNSEKLRLNDVADTMGYLTHVIKEQGWTKEDILKLID